jgi:hypothetical protein
MVQEFDLPQEIIDRKVGGIPGPHTHTACIVLHSALFILLLYPVLSHVWEGSAGGYAVYAALFMLLSLPLLSHVWEERHPVRG